jgi:pimeloyl-ACP methyl ester carboxylesterase
VRYETHGTGTPALVFVHGWSCDRRYWRGQLGHFAAQHQVVAIDLAGHGESGAGRAAWTMPAFGDDVVAVVEQLGLRDIVLIGHSMGGDVIVEAALRLRERLAGLVWVDVYRTLGEPARTPERTEQFAAPFREDFVTATQDFVRETLMPTSDPELVDWVAADMSSAPPEVALDALHHAISNDEAILAGLRELAAPFVAINPDNRRTDVEALSRHGVTTKLVSGVEHFPMLEDPDTFNRVLAETVEELRR